MYALQYNFLMHNQIVGLELKSCFIPIYYSVQFCKDYYRLKRDTNMLHITTRFEAFVTSLQFEHYKNISDWANMVFLCLFCSILKY